MGVVAPVRWPISARLLGAREGQTMMQPGYGYGATPSMRQEVPLLAEQGIQVTSARFIVYQQTYPINGITSVAPFSFQPSRTGPVVGAILFGLGTLGGLGALRHEGSIGMPFVCALLTGACVWWFISIKAQHGVMVSTAGMQHRALVTTDQGLVARVVHALNQAISMR